MSLTKLENTATQKEVVKKLVEANNVIIDKVLNTYTKEEIDNKINNNNGVSPDIDLSGFITNDMLETRLSMLDNVKGVIGVIDGLPEAYNGLNDILTSDFETVDELAFLYSNTYVYARFNMKIDNENYICYNSTANKVVWRFDFTLTNDKNIEVYTNSGSGWSKTTTVSMAHSKQITEENLYLHTFDILDTNKENIWKEKKELDATCDDYNEAVDNGIYRINGEALNGPSITKGLLEVKTDKSNIYMEAISSEKTETRFFDGESWTEWKEEGSGGSVDLEGIATEDFVRDYIDNLPSLPYQGIIGNTDFPTVFASCPVPEDIEVEAEICAFDVDNNRYVKIYFYNLNGANTLNIANYYTTSSPFYILTLNATNTPFKLYFKTETGAWTLYTGTNLGVNFKTKSLEVVRNLIYRNTLDIDTISASSSYTWSMEKLDDTTNTIGTYNITAVGAYRVEHNELLEGAIKAKFRGVLKVEKADNKIIHTLIEENGVCYTRYYANGVFSAWRGNIKTVGNIAVSVKSEFDEKLEYNRYWKVLPNDPEGYPYKIELSTSSSKSGTSLAGRVFYFKENPSQYIRYNTSTLKWTLLDGYESLDYKSYHIGNLTGTSSSEYLWTTTGTLTTYFSTYYVIKWHYHNFDILDQDGSIYRKSIEFNDGDNTTDFNEATEHDVYNININENDNISNSPVIGAFKGSLLNEKLDGKIKQTVIDYETESEYTRLYNGSWTEWIPTMKVEYGEHIVEDTGSATIEEVAEALNIERGLITAQNAYYVRISPSKKFRKVTGVSLSTDFASTIVASELHLNSVMINDTNDFYIFIKNKYIADAGYESYAGLEMLKGRKVKYSIIGY